MAARFEHETFISVADFVENGADRDEAFEMAADQRALARSLAAEELKEILTAEQFAQISTGKARFCEFDSPNWTHASARYEVVIEATVEIVEFLETYFERE